jgi:predicted O-methyltransferase YrrM
MLDIGGGHGFFSVALCRRHPQLHSTILELPQAIKHATPLLEKEGIGDRVRHRAGNALTDDLGVDQYDLVFMAAAHWAKASRLSRALGRLRSTRSPRTGPPPRLCSKALLCCIIENCWR